MSMFPPISIPGALGAAPSPAPVSVPGLAPVIHDPTKVACEPGTDRVLYRVISSPGEINSDGRSGKIVIESANPNFPLAIEELGLVAARHLALRYAASRGIPGPQINGNLSGPYPVNSQGEIVLQGALTGPDGKELLPGHPRMQPAAYRNDVPVCGRMV